LDQESLWTFFCTLLEHLPDNVRLRVFINSPAAYLHQDEVKFLIKDLQELANRYATGEYETKKVYIRTIVMPPAEIKPQEYGSDVACVRIWDSRPDFKEFVLDQKWLEEDTQH
jgi:hypothetical protein